ncbi:MAG: SufD family Fe-S cluster assembly protein [Sulfolobales archaeon]|nr:SufD family Fe-S cluster assembly protein [Sulfolobales archaeon]MCX8186440.1 SufD family Fe-S cluster assembly protein [Sulfolobales archaeon]MDW7969770.1 SufD family Fe-S cluster assembly protein [Sulfolobales archaeon]
MVRVDLKEQLISLLKRPSSFGPDIDLNNYELSEPKIIERLDIGDDFTKASSRLGLEDKSKLNYVQINESAMYEALRESLRKYNVKVLPLRKALDEFMYVKDMVWKLVKPDQDKYTAASYLYGGELGYFIYVPSNTNVPIPIYSCLAITSNNKVQFAHNVIYVDEGSEVQVVTGCLVPHGIKGGLHIGISEFYVGKNSRLTFTMLHAWSEGIHVRPRTGVRVNAGGEYVNYYVIYSPVASLQTYPTITLGADSKASTSSVIAGSGEGIYDVGTKVILAEDNSSVELLSKVVAKDAAEINARSDVVAESLGKGHVECLGLLLSPKSKISSIPALTSKKPGAILSHEAAIGIIAQEELEYLMSKGFKEDEAKSILIRGFIDIDVKGIPLSVKAEIDRVLDLIASNIASG